MGVAGASVVAATSARPKSKGGSRKSTSSKKHGRRKKKKRNKPKPLGLGMGFPFTNAAAVSSVLGDACSTPPEVRKLREERAIKELTADKSETDKQASEKPEANTQNETSSDAKVN